MQKSQKKKNHGADFLNHNQLGPPLSLIEMEINKFVTYVINAHLFKERPAHDHISLFVLFIMKKDLLF